MSHLRKDQIRGCCEIDLNSETSRHEQKESLVSQNLGSWPSLNLTSGSPFSLYAYLLYFPISVSKTGSPAYVSPLNDTKCLQL